MYITTVLMLTSPFPVDISNILYLIVINRILGCFNSNFCWNRVMQVIYDMTIVWLCTYMSNRAVVTLETWVICDLSNYTLETMCRIQQLWLQVTYSFMALKPLITCCSGISMMTTWGKNPPTSIILDLHMESQTAVTDVWIVTVNQI